MPLGGHPCTFYTILINLIDNFEVSNPLICRWAHLHRIWNPPKDASEERARQLGNLRRIKSERISRAMKSCAKLKGLKGLGHRVEYVIVVLSYATKYGKERLVSVKGDGVGQVRKFVVKSGF